MKDYKDFLGMAQDLTRRNGDRLLYLTLFGSRLYGTSTGSSDVDIRGLFLPSQGSLCLQRASRSLHYSTGDDESRNSSGDVDIDLWSLQHWLLKLLPSGDTGALDLLFSPSHESCVLYRDPIMDDIFSSPQRLLDLTDGQAYTSYAMGQAKKYGIKGSRLGAIKQVHRWLHEMMSGSDARLGDVLEDLVRTCGDGRYCTAETAKDGGACLQLCGKFHMADIRIDELIRRVDQDMERHGTRAAEAELDQGVDFKALSHAIRALEQMDELLDTGKVVFPLKGRGSLMKIKRGEYSWQEIEPLILDRLHQTDLKRMAAKQPHHYDRDFAEGQILAAYGLRTDPTACSVRSSI